MSRLQPGEESLTQEKGAIVLVALKIDLDHDFNLGGHIKDLQGRTMRGQAGKSPGLLHLRKELY